MKNSELNFRVFISSTFSDFVDERNALQSQVFPQLAAYCLERKVRFQAIDLRWGVSSEAGADQQTMNICLQELKRCQLLSPRPNFLVLLGERYGWRPLPTQIDATTFEKLSGVLREDAYSVLTKWYRRDDNAVPAQYFLLAREGDFLNHKRWTSQEAVLREILLTGIDTTLPDDPRRLEWRRSATHLEIEHGALTVADADQHVLCYFRQINGLPIDDRAARYRDLNDGEMDHEAQAQLESLRGRLELRIPESHVYRWQANWTGAGPSSDLDLLCERVASDLQRIIDREILNFQGISRSHREIEQHLEFARVRGALFVGRRRLLDHLVEYISSDESCPLIIYGPAGVGKSAVIAQSSLSQQQLVEPIVVSRFIGATPDSTDLRLLLNSIWYELGLVSDGGLTIPDDLRALINGLPQQLSRAAAHRPVILYLDALEQLSPRDNAHGLHWLPRELPSNIKIIVSTLQAEGSSGECLRNARQTFPKEHFLEVGPLSVDEQESMVGGWLEAGGRTLQKEQRSLVLTKAAASPYPLYLKLACEEARRWKSSEIPSETTCRLGSDVPSILENLFERIEQPQNHGEVLVNRTLSYLAVSRHGLSEDELLDVLSRDPEAMQAFRDRSPESPPVDHLPIVVWSRLFAELEPYLMVRNHRGLRLLTFYQRQLGDAVSSRYLVGDWARRAHRRLADYFREQESQQLNTADSAVYRRGLEELPWQLTKAEEWHALRDVLADPSFLNAVWLQSSYDARSYWAALQKQGGVEPIDTYRHLLASPEREGERLWGVLTLLEYNGYPNEALDAWDKFLDHYRRIGDVDREGVCCVAVARLLVDRDTAAANRLLRRPKGVARKGGTPLESDLARQELLGAQADTLLRELSHPDANPFLNQWYGIYKLILRILPISISLRMPRRPKLNEAMSLLSARELICRQIGEGEGLASSLCARGQLIYREYYDAARALGCIEEAERLSGELNNEEGLHLCRSVRAKILFDQGMADEALAIEAEAEHIFRASGNQLMLAQCLSAQARFLLDGRGDQQMALKKCEESLGIFMDLESDRMIRTKALLTRIQFGLTTKRAVIVAFVFVALSCLNFLPPFNSAVYHSAYGIAVALLFLFLYLGTTVFYSTRGVAQRIAKKHRE
jgi:hypothetical protein